jgi:hypothetical protein
MPSAERMEFSEFSLDFEGLQWRRGGWVKYLRRLGHGTAGLSFGDFFLVARILGGPQTKFASRSTAAARASSIYFLSSADAGGGQKSGTFPSRTGALPTQTFPRVSRNIFWSGGRQKLTTFRSGIGAKAKTPPHYSAQCFFGHTAAQPWASHRDQKNSPRHSGWGG